MDGKTLDILKIVHPFVFHDIQLMDKMDSEQQSVQQPQQNIPPFQLQPQFAPSPFQRMDYPQFGENTQFEPRQDYRPRFLPIELLFPQTNQPRIF